MTIPLNNNMFNNDNYCSNCGIYTHHNPRSNPALTGFNLGCLEDFDIFQLKDVAVNDGQNHPLDKK